jgi:NADPH-dependent 2,4-dienoyl-CoA reductase/sulfur reductase-like enzyme
MADRARFTVDGRPAEAEAGTSLLAALWNSGRRAVRTSASGEARGPLCGMGTCFECRVTVDGEPHRRACLEGVREGMHVIPRDSRLPGPEESAVGIADSSSPGQIGAPRNDTAEVVVVGAGPAGIAAAVHAAEAGARTLVLDEQTRPGGQVWRGEPPRAARAWLDRLARSGVTRLDRAAVVDAPRPGELLVEREGRPLRVGYERLVLATGARELFLPFPGWTLPGVVGAGGAQALLKAGARFDGLRVVVAGSGPLLPAAAAALKRSGARVVGVVEQAPLPRLAAFAASLWREPGKLAEGLGYGATLAGVPYRTGAWVREAIGRDAVEGLRVTDGRREWSWACDVLACGFGLVPSLELPRLLGCETTGDAVVVDAAQRTSVDSVFAAGELVGVAGVDQALATGAIAGLAAAGREAPGRLLRERARARRFGERLAAAFALRDELKTLARPETTLCRCEDVPLGRVAGATTAREAKLDARAGMGPCQGRVCGPALAFLRGLPPDTVRPPLVPVPIGVLAAEEEAPTSPAAGAPGPAPRRA